MGRHRLGPWIAGTFVVGCVVLALLISIDDPRSFPAAGAAHAPVGEPTQTSEPQRRHVATQTVPPQREPGACVVVRVVAAEDGSPIAGAAVDVPEAGDATLREVSGADGTARFPRLAPHEWRFRARMPGRLERTAEVLAEDGCDTPLDIPLEGAATLMVRVLGPQGEPVPAADVSASEVGGGAESSGATATDGRVRVAIPWDSPILVVARSSELGEAEIVLSSPTTGKRLEELELRLPGLGGPGRVLWGEVVDADGALVPGARLSLLDASGATRDVLADAHGVFAVRLAPGPWKVSAEDGNSEEVDVGESADAHVRLTGSR